MRKFLFLLLCLVSATLARAQSYTYRYWLDKNEATVQTFQEGATAHLELDISQMAAGVHELHVQVTDAAGKQSGTKTQIFYVAEPERQLDAATTQCYYIIDGEEGNRQSGTLAGETYHFDIDATALNDGLHSITCMLVDGSGQTSQMRHAFFVKTGSNHIASYQYWVNDDTEHTTTVQVSGSENPFEKVELLDVAAQPVRSSSFHFEIVDGSPCIFARNVLHFRFFDAERRYAEGTTAEYIDYNAPQQIIGADRLVADQDMPVAIPEKDGIHWFYVSARAGELLRVKTDKACTLQLFSPSSEEIYSAQGADALEYEDIRLTENGNYYLALHDVAETSDETVTLQNQYLQALELYNGTADMMAVIPNGSTKPAEATAENAIMLVNKQLADADPLLSLDNLISLDAHGQWMAKSIVLTDAKPFYCPVDATAEQVTYIRTFKQGTWQALYLPYNMAYDDWKDIGKVARFSNIRQYDDDGDEVYERLVMEYELVKENEEILPNVPYVIRPDEGGTYTFESQNRRLRATPAVDGMVDCSTTKFKYEMQGFYQPFAVSGAPNIYALNNEGNFMRLASSVVLTPFRLTLKITEREGNYAAEPSSRMLPAKVAIHIIGEDSEGTAVEEVCADNDEGAYFDLMGRRVDRPGRGLYIHNGKKVLIK